MDMSSQYIQYRTGRIDKETFLDRKSEKEAIKDNLAEELSRHQAEAKRILYGKEERRQSQTARSYTVWYIRS